MKGKVMAPFRAPREGRGRDVLTKEIVHRKDNSRRFKELEQTMGRLLTGMQTKDVDKDFTEKGTGVSSPSKKRTTKAKPVNARSSKGLDDDLSNPWWPQKSPDEGMEATNSDNEDDDIPFSQLARERQPQKPIEAEGLGVSDNVVAVEAPQVTSVAVDRLVFNNVVAVQLPRRSVRMNTLSEGKRHVDSDSDDNDIPITTTLRNPPKVLPTPVCPKGNDAMGLMIARDFGVDGGIYHGKITAVDMNGRRTYYHVTYDDGDEEDFDYDELKYAVGLQEAVALGRYVAPMEDEDQMSDGEGSVHVPSEKDSDDSSEEIVKKKVTRKRISKGSLHQGGAPLAKRNKTLQIKHTTESVLETYKEDTEYGQSFRRMPPSEQRAEVQRLNRGANKGTTIAIKSKVLVEKYKHVCADKMREHLSTTRTQPALVFRAAPPSRASLLLSPTFLSVGEWVEVDADRTPGWNSEGGIGVVIAVQDSFADVK